jgi:hypothetical protein
MLNPAGAGAPALVAKIFLYDFVVLGRAALFSRWKPVNKTTEVLTHCAFAYWTAVSDPR